MDFLFYYPFYEWRSSVKNFRFVPNELPLGSWNAVIFSILLYLSVIFGLQRFMKDRKRFELSGFVLFHNLWLSMLSLVMGLGILYEVFTVLPSNLSYGMSPMSKLSFIGERLLCDSEKKLHSGMAAIWYYIFFLSKFYEFIDTVIIALKKNRIIFLHVYHHCITLVLVFVMMSYQVAISWVAITANALVHVPMYYYYAISSLGMTVPWKRYITLMQIIQFVVDVSANAFTIIYYYHLKNLPCSGPEWAWWFGQAVIISFLILFIAFYNKSYHSSNPEHSNIPSGQASTPKTKPPVKQQSEKKDQHQKQQKKEPKPPNKKQMTQNSVPKNAGKQHQRH